MDIQIFQYKESHLEGIRIILNEYLSFIAKELTRQPWSFNLDVEHEVNFTMNNLDKFAKKLNIITLAESLGGVKSLISCPYSMTHASVPKDEKMKLGITPNLLRFSVGIEHVEDLISELDFAMSDN